jgi:hypothetical protein
MVVRERLSASPAAARQLVQMVVLVLVVVVAVVVVPAVAVWWVWWVSYFHLLCNDQDTPQWKYHTTPAPLQLST